jgi:putative chitinase
MQFKRLFEELRKGILGPTLDSGEVGGTETIVNSCKSTGWPISWAAYALATAYHETAHTMLPIKEFGGYNYFMRMYDVTGNRPKMAAQYGNTSPGDGAKYYGRGYVQLTWKINYEKAEKICGIIGLAKNPDLALVKENAAKIMISGMETGWFSPGNSCKKHLPAAGLASLGQFTSARKIINGTDKNTLIATYAMRFQDALLKSGY